MAKYKTVEAWIEEVLTDENLGKCTAMGLLYHKQMGGTQEVYGQKLTGKTWSPETLAAIFKGKAESHAQDKEGIHTFELKAFFDEKGSPLVSHEFKVRDGEVVQGKDGARVVTEHPDGKGLVAIAMSAMARKDDIIEKMATQAAVNLQLFMDKMLARDAARDVREDKLNDEVNDAYLIVRNMVMDKSEQENRHAIEQLKFQRNSAERLLILKHLPMLINGMSDNPVFPQSAVDTGLVEMIAETISAEDIQMMVAMGKIDDKQAMALTSRINQYKDKKRKEAEALKQLPAANAEDPREDAAGTSGSNLVQFKNVKDAAKK